MSKYSDLFQCDVCGGRLVPVPSGVVCERARCGGVKSIEPDVKNALMRAWKRERAISTSPPAVLLDTVARVGDREVRCYTVDGELHRTAVRGDKKPRAYVWVAKTGRKVLVRLVPLRKKRSSCQLELYGS